MAILSMTNDFILRLAGNKFSWWSELDSGHQMVSLNMLTDHLAMPPASIVSMIWVTQQPGDSHYKFIRA